MKSAKTLALVASLLISGQAFAKDTGSATFIELDSQQMDRITAGDLILPNGKEIFDNFDNPSGQTSGSGFGACGVLGPLAGGDAETGCHPALSNKSPTAVTASGGIDGPWQAAVHSPVISCASDLAIAPAPCPAGSF